MDRCRKRQGNSLGENSRWIFITKCINRLLPTLEKRHLFWPDLYKDSLCPRCKNKEETFEHLLECKADKGGWTKVEKEVKEKLENIFISKEITGEQKRKIIILLFPRKQSELKLRRLETSRGFIPKGLVKEINSLGISKKKTKLILENYIEEWFLRFKVDIWQTRCEEIIKWEKEEGISRKIKRSKPNKRKKKEKSTLSKSDKQIEKEDEGYTAQAIAFNEIEKWIRTGNINPWIMY